MSHRAIYTADDSCTFVDRGEFTVEVSRKSLSAWNLSFGGGNLTHRLGKRSHIRQDDKNVHMPFKSQIFRDSQGNLRSDESFYDRVICKVQEHGNMVGNTAFFKSIPEEISDIMLDSHSGKYNSKLFIGIIPQRGLLYDLCRKLVMRGVRFLRKSEVSVRGSVWSVRRWRRYRCGYSSGGIPCGSGSAEDR